MPTVTSTSSNPVHDEPGLPLRDRSAVVGIRQCVLLDTRYSWAAAETLGGLDVHPIASAPSAPPKHGTG